ncbi:MAG: hypothetical protein PHC84_05980 [Clostridia bacterium]|nr:hypothetical protein [Clostridia bacterium]
MFYTNYANKELMTVKDAKNVGRIDGVYIDKISKRAVALMVSTPDGEKALPLKKVAGCADKITVYSVDLLQDADIEKLYLLTKDTEAYNEDGNRLGNFADISITGDRLIWFDKPYPARYISGTGDNGITINMNSRLQKSVVREAKSKLKQQAAADQSVVDDYSFLLGRIVIRDIVDKSCGVNIRKGTVISNSVLEQAKQGGKLVYLALSSLLD